MTSRVSSLMALGIAAIGISYLFLEHALFSSNPIGITVQVLAAGLMLWARMTFGKRSFHAGANPTAGGLVTRGPYRFLRHPIYAAVSYFVLAGVFSYRSAWLIAAAVLVVLSLVVRMLLEERLLIIAYPEYKEYAKKAKRLIPFLF